MVGLGFRMSTMVIHGLSGQFLWDVWNGDQDPRSAGEWLHGLMYGPAKAQ